MAIVMVIVIVIVIVIVMAMAIVMVMRDGYHTITTATINPPPPPPPAARRRACRPHRCSVAPRVPYRGPSALPAERQQGRGARVQCAGKGRRRRRPDRAVRHP